MIEKIINYIKESKLELKRVNWPTHRQTLNYTFVVIGLSLVVAVFLGAFDFLFIYLFNKFLF